jgi:hypothetical protein
MTIDNDAAALLAQVIPALLVFLALEDRLMPAKIPSQKWRARLTRWREGAVVMNLLALGLCLTIVVTDVEETWLRIGVATFVAFSVASLLVVLAFLFAGMFLSEESRREDLADSVN